MFGFFTETINNKNANYKGVYRLNADLWDVKITNTNIKNIANKYIENSVEGIYIDDNNIDFDELIKLYKFLKSTNSNVELVHFSEQSEKFKHFKTVGFDIVSNSLSFSPLGDDFLVEFDANYSFDNLLGKEKFDFYKSQINENGLFEDIFVAKQFSDDCNSISKIDSHAIETEFPWFPIEISIYKENSTTF